MLEGVLATSIIVLDTKLMSVFQANSLTDLLGFFTKWPTVPYFVLILWHMSHKSATFLSFFTGRVKNDQVEVVHHVICFSV